MPPAAHSGSEPATDARASRGTSSTPPRTATSDSPEAKADESACSTSPSASTSTRTIRPGFSDCAERTRPHTEACTRSAGPSPGATVTAPRVRNARRASAKRSSDSHRWSSVSTRPASACTASATSVAAGSPHDSTSAPGIASRSSRTCAPASSRMTQSPNRASDGISSRHSTRNSASPWPPTCRPSCSGEKARRARLSTEATGTPSASAISRRTASRPARESRTRRVSAPVEWTATPDQENGSRGWPVSSTREPSPMACRTESRSAG
ncbi:hypothetical protein EES37_20505 [Streptomyces sp. ADI91-18]|nr:hypothetical protein EES37_20505 [Streptomyces sp. ADI91-18]